MPDRQKKNLNPSTMIFGFLVCVGLYLIFATEDNVDQSTSLTEPSIPSLDVTTIEKNIRQRSLDIQMKKNMKTQEVLSEALDAGPVGYINIREPDVSSLDMDLSFPEDQRIKSFFKDLNMDHLDDDAYEDPEAVIHRQLEYHDWVSKYLEEKSEREKQKFIKHFVQTAKKQGYNVHFKEGSKVVLEPIRKSKKKKPLDKLKVNWR